MGMSSSKLSGRVVVMLWQGNRYTLRQVKTINSTACRINQPRYVFRLEQNSPLPKYFTWGIMMKWKS